MAKVSNIQTIPVSKQPLQKTAFTSTKVGPNTLERQPKQDVVSFTGFDKEKPAGRNALPAIASFFLSGLGQMLNGDIKGGLAHMAGTYGGATVASGLAMGATVASISNPVVGAVLGVGALACAVGSAVSFIHSIVDAYRDNTGK